MDNSTAIADCEREALTPPCDQQDAVNLRPLDDDVKETIIALSNMLELIVDRRFNENSNAACFAAHNVAIQAGDLLEVAKIYYQNSFE